jgi:hypothetical protein
MFACAAKTRRAEAIHLACTDQPGRTVVDAPSTAGLKRNRE